MSRLPVVGSDGNAWGAVLNDFLSVVHNADGTLAFQPSGTAAALVTGGTITTIGVGIARVAPTANVTGIILQAPTNARQFVIVRNESAFTITFDVVGTSLVADGATSAIAANTSRMFEWNGSLWYRCNG